MRLTLVIPSMEHDGDSGDGDLGKFMGRGIDGILVPLGDAGSGQDE